MATIGVLTYNFPPGLKLKNSLNKLPIVGNNIVGLNSQNSIVTKIENIGMIGGEVVVVRKKQMPLTESNVANIQQAQVPTIPVQNQLQQQMQQQPAKRIKMEEVNSPPGGGKKSTPQPQAVARRNARERRRVKQVNDGFTALRQHIPEEVASAFEAAGNGRGTAKKLSKVETLRMAVEYIRSLERILEIDPDANYIGTDALMTPTKTVIKTESCSPPIIDAGGQCSDSNYDPDESTIFFTDTLPDITTLNGQQYIRIPGTNTYQLITADVFENEENIRPLNVSFTCSSYPRAIDLTDPSSGQIEYTVASSTPTGLMNTTAAATTTIIAPAPISPPPSDYNDSASQSISPVGMLDHQQRQHQLHSLVAQVQMQQQQQQQHHLPSFQDRHQLLRIRNEDQPSVHIYRTHLAPSSSPLDEGQGYVEAHLYDGSVIALKREIKVEDNEVVLDTTAGLSEESMMEAIDWWDSHTPQSDDSEILS